MLILNDENKYKIEDLNQKERMISTLLVPQKLVDGFLQKRKELHGNNTANFLKSLLKMYRIVTYSGMIPPSRITRTEYQNVGLDLKRLSFRPDNADWLELGELALAFGKSRCWMFTFLLELDLLGISSILSEYFDLESVPTLPNFSLVGYVCLERYFQTFTRGYHVKV